VDVAAVVELARSEISKFIVNYKIPQSMERRFDWLSAGDVSIKQMLLGHVQEMQKTLVVEAVRAQVPVMLEHMRAARLHTGRLAQIIRIAAYPVVPGSTI